ncbi:MAG: hypothetical protein WC379_03315 [Methanoregula sp.]|jgi:hypothetical protein
MTENPMRDTRGNYLEALVPVLAFGSTLLGIALWESGTRFEIQYAAAGSFLASCLLAYLAWHRPRKDIVSLTTPLYGFIFLVTSIDYYSGILLQLFYATGLTILVIRLHYRFGAGAAVSSDTELPTGPLRDYVESTRDTFAGLDAVTGRSAVMAFFAFAEGNYRKTADVSHAASCHDGTPAYVIRAFTVLRQHAELLDKNQPRPVTYLKFLPDDAPFMAKPLPADADPDAEFEAMMDNALLLLYGAAWYGSPENRPSLIAAQPFAKKLLEG